MTPLQFELAGGAAVAAQVWGDPRHPPVLMLGPALVAADPASDIAALLAEQRWVIVVDAALALDIAGLRELLARLDARPVVIAYAAAAAVAVAALLGPPASGDAPWRAAALILCQPQFATAAAESRGERRAPTQPTLPCLLRGHAEAVALAAGHLQALGQPFEVDAAEADASAARLAEFVRRRVAAQSVGYAPGQDARLLRDVLGCFATGITVVTTRDASGRPLGLTANSFTSVSLDPPLVLFCLGRGGGSLDAFSNARHFAVNVLGAAQQALSNRFAAAIDDRFATVDWRPSFHGSPLLDHALAHIDCERHALHDGGDHLIVVGRVLTAHCAPQRDPLLYFRGRYRRLAL